MQVVTQCGHEYTKPWSEAFIRYAPFFFCEICGKSQTFPLDTVVARGYAESVNANEYYAAQGWALVPDTMEEAHTKPPAAGYQNP